MEIYHKIINKSGKDTVYIYVTIQDIYEFGKENLGKGENTNFLTKLRAYINENLGEAKKLATILVINGVVIGSLSMAMLYPNTEVKNNGNVKLNQIQVYKENNEKTDNDDDVKEEKAEIQNKKEEVELETTKNEEIVKNNTTNNTNKTNSSKVNSNKLNNNKTNTNTNSIKTNTSNKTNTKPKAAETSKKDTVSSKTSTTDTTEKKENTNTQINANTNTNINTNTNTSTQNNNVVSSGVKINFNNKGVISKIDLEEYVIGVVAAEMPASFHSEALKAQAVVARTYAMKKASKGITLINSTTHQVYYTNAQMKNLWGNSYNTYYNKIKNAVNATRGKVLKYNGSYIDALYFSMSNGKTELPKYVWSTNYPYLQVVSSYWDENISAAKYTTKMTYDKLSSKLGVKVDKNSEIKVISKTAGDRVNEISISGKGFTGVKVRSLLGLRSADFTISKTEEGVTITTKGFGHGVGMSQYGANGAAKAGYTYSQILKHYYSGVSLVNI